MEMDEAHGTFLRQDLKKKSYHKIICVPRFLKKRLLFLASKSRFCYNDCKHCGFSYDTNDMVIHQNCMLIPNPETMTNSII